MSDGVERGTSEQSGAVSEPEAAPLLRIVTPGTTPEEVAAIVAVFASMGGDSPTEPAPRSTWASVERRIHTGHQPGRNAWRNSLLPR